MLFEKKFHPIALCWGDRLASFSNNLFYHATSTPNGKTADYTWRSLTFYSLHFRFYSSNLSNNELCNQSTHGLRTPREEIAFTVRPKIQSQSQIFRYGRSIFCLPHRPNFSDIFDLCLHWVSVVRGYTYV